MAEETPLGHGVARTTPKGGSPTTSGHEEREGETPWPRGGSRPRPRSGPLATLYVAGEPNLATNPWPSSHPAVLGWFAGHPTWSMEREMASDNGSVGGCGRAGGVGWLRAVGKKIKCFCSHFIFLLQADLASSYWWAKNTPFLQ